MPSSATSGRRSRRTWRAGRTTRSRTTGTHTSARSSCALASTPSPTSSCRPTTAATSTPRPPPSSPRRSFGPPRPRPSVAAWTPAPSGRRSCCSSFSTPSAPTTTPPTWPQQTQC